MSVTESVSNMPDTQAGSAKANSGKKRKFDAGRTSQACTRCRSLKMKCIGATDPPCRRCRRTGSTCDFVPRANAAVPLSPGPYPSHSCTELWRNEVNARLKLLEQTNARLEILVKRFSNGSEDVENDEPTSSSSIRLGEGVDGPDSDSDGGDSTVLSGVWEAVERIKQELSNELLESEAWNSSVVSQLWESFRSHMPGLHFFSGQVSFTHPTPLLSVAILYVAAAHFPTATLARYQPVYFQAFTRAIATLAIPDCDIRGTAKEDSDGTIVSGKFDDVLGIILVGLLAVGWVDTVGMWVNTAYRLLLDGMAEERGRRQPEWKGLWEGLRTIELEHSSLHLICPALPRSPPDPPFTMASLTSMPNNAAGSIGELLAIMQHRMPRFVGRGLPTVWDTVCSTGGEKIGASISAEPDDMAAIRAWAAEIDAWYSRSATATTNASMYERSIILLNYHLHKLFVLSIFFPLRGVTATAAFEREELLESSRLVLKIEATGFEVWSSWDLVIITNASLILLQAWSIGSGDSNDLNLVQNHLNTLTCTQQSAPSLRHTLSTRLERVLQQVRTPVRTSKMLPAATISPAQDFVAAQVPAVRIPAWPVSSSIPTHAPLGASTPMMTTTTVGMGGPVGYSPNRSGYNLFMDQAPTLGILPDWPTLSSLSENANLAEWPPFLLNLFGEGEAGSLDDFSA